ncbi:Holliday junction branch migration DNA helicase RuvB [Candidatus Dojkabacteria bacterium]|nr:Holliday junction branch migration DNA helicase RuvB [Candidatus Dojkabacteria bacterium]
MDNLFNPNLHSDEELVFESSMRPKNFNEVIGRENLIINLQLMINAAKKRGDALDHILFHGPPGLGKTSICNVIANEMNVPIHTTSGPAIERQGDLASIISNIEDKAILFIDEIHRLNRVVEEILYPAMEDRVIDLVVGKGPSAKTLRLELQKFTLIGATTKVGSLSAPLRDRFGASFRFEFYEYPDLSEIVKQKAEILKITIDTDSSMEIARRSRRTPRVAIRILKRVRDLAEMENNGVISLKEVAHTLKMLEIDSIGLDYLDRKILHTILENYEGGPVGLSTLAAAISEDKETIEEVYEPFLIQSGLLQRTPRGRIITHKGIKHLNIN